MALFRIFVFCLLSFVLALPSVDLQPLEDGTECERRGPRARGCRQTAANTGLIERSSSRDLTSLALFTSLAGITITKTRKVHKNRMERRKREREMERMIAASRGGGGDGETNYKAVSAAPVMGE